MSSLERSLHDWANDLLTKHIRSAGGCSHLPANYVRNTARPARCGSRSGIVWLFYRADVARAPEYTYMSEY